MITSFRLKKSIGFEGVKVFFNDTQLGERMFVISDEQVSELMERSKGDVKIAGPIITRWYLDRGPGDLSLEEPFDEVSEDYMRGYIDGFDSALLMTDRHTSYEDEKYSRYKAKLRTA